MTYCVSALDPAAVLPKCAAARTASAPIWSTALSTVVTALSGTAGRASSNQTPLTSEPVGTPMCGAVDGQDSSPAAMPSQYCCDTDVQSSPGPYRPFMKLVRYAAAGSVLDHCEPQNTR